MVAVLLIRIPIMPVDFLKYEPKDVIITIAGFIYGPLASVAISVTVSFVEMVTISSTYFWGFLMNILSTVAFTVPAVIIYRKYKNFGSQVAGLLVGVVMQVGVMLLWNWLITPIYMGYPRDAVVAMLVPVFLPFNLIKSSINAVIALVLHRAVAQIEKAARG